MAVDTPGHLLVHTGRRLRPDRAAESLAVRQATTGETVELGYVDQGYTGETPRRPEGAAPA